MTEIKAADPKIFISYSWSNPDHEAWVVSFAGELTSQGIHVVLDKWDLQPGHDANAFMESMVTDPDVNKVILICDKKYAEKSDSRSGGAGTEAQIITPSLYAKQAQDKFVAVVRERDDEGRAYLPVYYGSRIYVDLTNPSTYGAEFEKLVRWAYGKPLHVRPERGAKPSFLSESAAPGKIASAVSFRRASDAIRNNQPNSAAVIGEYFSVVASGFESFRITMTEKNRNTYDDLVVASVEEFLPYRNEIIEIFTTIAQYGCTPEVMHVLHRFFESLIPYLKRPEHVQSWNDSDYDNFKFIIHELFLYAIAIFLRFEKFDAAAYLIVNEYFWENRNDGGENMHSYLLFRDHLRMLEYRNQRLGLRRLSVRADMLSERNKMTGIDFKFVMAADFILYLRSQNSSVWQMWWPETLLYTNRYGGAFEVFARARSARYFDQIKNLLGVQNKEELSELLKVITSDRDRIPKWQYESINPTQLLGLDAIATKP